VLEPIGEVVAPFGEQPDEVARERVARHVEARHGVREQVALVHGQHVRVRVRATGEG
jgi:hypothetical protein